VTPLVVLELQAILGSVVTDVQGLGVDERGRNPLQLGPFGPGQLLVASNGQGEESTHVVDETTRLGGDIDLNSIGEPAKIISF
jgi:hypothetical protein